MRRAPERKPTPEDIERWVNESGMGRGKQADALGDEPNDTPDQDGAGVYEKAMSERVGRLEKEEEEEEVDKSLRGRVY